MDKSQKGFPELRETAPNRAVEFSIVYVFSILDTGLVAAIRKKNKSHRMFLGTSSYIFPYITGSMSRG
jgi:hypothetical protein